MKKVCDDAAHTTVAFYVWVIGKQLETCVWSPTLYMDRESPDRVEAFEYDTKALTTLTACRGTLEGCEQGSKQCEETQEETTPKKMKKEMTRKKTGTAMAAKKTGKARLPQPKGSMSEEKQLQPRAHSEIAALQHLFGITRGANAMEWAEIIQEELTRRDGYLYVVLFNSNHPPCGPGDRVSAKQHPETYERAPCDQFLQAVVNLVNSREDRFSIRVVWPMGKGFNQAVYTHLDDDYGDKVQEHLLNIVQKTPRNGASTKSHGKKRKSQQDAMLPRDLGEDLVDAALRLLLMILLDT